MPKIVLKNPVITVNSVDMSDHVSSLTIDLSADEVDATAFGPGNFREKLQGLADASFTLGMQQDFAAGEVDATLWPLFSAGSTFPVSAKATTAATSATNPLYSMTGVLLSYSPLDGSVGDLAETEVEITNASATGVTRATS